MFNATRYENNNFIEVVISDEDGWVETRVFEKGIRYDDGATEAADEYIAYWTKED